MSRKPRPVAIQSAGTAPAGDVLHLNYPPQVTAVAEARAALGQALDRTGHRLYRERARLVLDELLWNVVVHTSTEADVRVVAGAMHVLVEVADGSQKPPLLERPPPDAHAGRGLLIVDELADAWGWSHRDAGKVVWARFDERSWRSAQWPGNGQIL